MNQPQTEDQQLDELELLARYLVLMIQNSDYTDEEKTAWVAVLPFMKPEQIVKLAELLQGQLETKMQALQLSSQSL